MAWFEQDGKLFDKDGQELSPEIAAALAALESEEIIPPPGAPAPLPPPNQRIIRKMIEQGYGGPLLPHTRILNLIWEAWVRRYPSATAPSG